MQDKVTGQDLIQFLKEYCKESNKLFIPDSPRQEAVAEALVEYYNGQLLKESIMFFVKSRSGPFLLFDFAIESKKITEKIKQEQESKDKLMRIIQDTKNRMANE